MVISKVYSKNQARKFEDHRGFTNICVDNMSHTKNLWLTLIIKKRERNRNKCLINQLWSLISYHCLNPSLIYMFISNLLPKIVIDYLNNLQCLAPLIFYILKNPFPGNPNLTWIINHYRFEQPIILAVVNLS